MTRVQTMIWQFSMCFAAPQTEAEDVVRQCCRYSRVSGSSKIELLCQLLLAPISNLAWQSADCHYCNQHNHYQRNQHTIRDMTLLKQLYCRCVICWWPCKLMIWQLHCIWCLPSTQAVAPVAVNIRFALLLCSQGFVFPTSESLFVTKEVCDRHSTDHTREVKCLQAKCRLQRLRPAADLTVSRTVYKRHQNKLS